MPKYTKRADGRLQTKIHIGNGKFKYFYGANEREIERKLIEAKIKLGKGLDIIAERDTFKQWADDWLAMKKPEVAYKRWQAYGYRIDNLKPIHSMRLSDIRTNDIQRIIADMAESGYAKRTLAEVKSTARQVLQLAIDNRVIDYNAADSVRIPAKAPQNTKRALTEQEQEWIVNTPHRAQRAAMIMLYAGLRRGELLSLRWTDIDLEARTIDVRRATEFQEGKPVEKNVTKTEAGMRTVYIPRRLADFLRNENRGTNLIVCPSAQGKIMSESAWRRLWDSYLGELNFKYGKFIDPPKSKYQPKKIPFVIPRITAHWLRHTFITIMYFAGMDIITAKEQAGHADIKTTIDIYTHLDDKYKRKRISQLDNYLDGENGTEKEKDGSQ